MSSSKERNQRFQSSRNLAPNASFPTMENKIIESLIQEVMKVPLFDTLT